MAKAPKFSGSVLSAKNIHKGIIAEGSVFEQEFSQLERSFQAIAPYPRFKQRFYLLKLAPYFGIPRSAFIRLFDAYICEALIKQLGGAE
ncbi:hypothetical protein H6G80_03925 [Nostoc sp. FACHB-87]|uniref:hypothetical protein n=1 Tax=Nostocaceae TaxID=1162 RepID=UPI0016849056|nr:MULTISPECIES: hypothetical protein [Nostocaceae]MBD2453223.1 hypothetical protein [Nostoc sp. FACHB-87]MBD2474997.1 hypothetical protein [Anabaena sp. FACHB-83]